MSNPLAPTSMEIDVNTLYEVEANGRSGSTIQPAIEVAGDAVSIYGSMTQPVSGHTGMTLGAADFEDIQPFAVLPKYLYITGGTPNKIILIGITAKEV